MIPQYLLTLSSTASAGLQFAGALSMANQYFRANATENLKVFFASLFGFNYASEAADTANSLPEVNRKTLRGLTWIATGFLLQLGTNLAVLAFGSQP